MTFAKTLKSSWMADNCSCVMANLSSPPCSYNAHPPKQEVTPFISIFTNGEHKALWFCGGGEGSSHAFLYFLRGPSSPHSPTHSTVHYIGNHPSPCKQQPPKYHTCSVKNTYLKTPNENV